MILNHINQRKHDNEVRCHVPDEGRADKPCKAIKTAAEKIVILVRPTGDAAKSLTPAAPSNHCCGSSLVQKVTVALRIWSEMRRPANSY